MASNHRINIPFRASCRLVLGYVARRLREQICSVAFIVAYLFVFQLIVLRLPLTQGGRVVSGIGMVVLGLTLFLEGIRLGVIPLGRQVGLKLLERCKNFRGAIPFAFIVGFGATLAEPAIAGLRKMGSTVPAWESPLLYQLLEQYTSALLIAVAVGVGIAVILGLVRFYYGLSLKPFIFIIIPLLLFMTAVALVDEKLSSIIGLAWDTGAVTTGAVTVPLVIAIGLGVSRAAGRSEDEQGGFGTIMLASALPVLTVFILAFFLRADVPEPMDQHDFFSPEKRNEALKLFNSEEALCRYAFTQGNERGRRAFFSDEDKYRETLRKIAEEPKERRRNLGPTGLDQWLEQKASDQERRFIERYRVHSVAAEASIVPMSQILAKESIGAIRVIMPLTLFLLLVMWLFLRQRPRYGDEVIAGIIIAIAGMTLLTAGIRTGLHPLGDSVGNGLPQTFQADEEDNDTVIIQNFDEDIVFAGITPDGEKKEYFLLQLEDRLQKVPYEHEQYDQETNRYVYVKKRNLIFKAGLSLLGIGLVFLFAFGLGYGSTLVEPALHALGETVESATVGTVKSNRIVHVVALGVGIGIMAGVARFIYTLPVAWLLIPPYLLLLPLTLLSDEEFTGIAWDSGGVTTGPVTVSLVLAMGLGLGDSLAIGDSFGILACASVYPVITVLVYGLIIRRCYWQSIRTREGDSADER